MKAIAPAGWVAILVFIATVGGCVAMVYIAQHNAWSPAEVSVASGAQPS